MTFSMIADSLFCSSQFHSHRAAMASAISAVEQKKDAQRATALSDLRAELQGLVDRAYAERDEHLANYTKVRVILCLFFVNMF